MGGHGPERANGSLRNHLAGVHLVTDRQLREDDRLVAAVSAAVDAGVVAVHLRERDPPSGTLFELARSLREVTRGRALLIVNDRADIAVAVAADGVQLGERSLPVAAAHSVVRAGMLVGRSVHSVEAAAMARDAGADFLVVGTIFPSRSHPGQETAGVELIREVRAVFGGPLIGIGGVTEVTAAEVIAAGADGVAVISAILATDRPGQAASRLVEVVRAASRAQNRSVEEM